MNHPLIIILVSLAVLPSSAIGDETKKAKKRVYRSISTETVELAGVNRSISTRQTIEIAKPSVPDTENGQNFEDSSNPKVSVRRAWENEAATAIGIGETYYRQGRWESAGEWYLKALDLDPVSAQAAEGLVMSACQAGQFYYAYQIGEEFSDTLPGIKEKVIKAANIEIELILEKQQFDKAIEMLANFPLEETGFDEARQKVNCISQESLLVESGPVVELSPSQVAFQDAAVIAYRSDQFSSALWNIEQIGKENELSRESLFIKAWSLYYTGRYDESYQVFENLYKKQTDTASARGIVISLRRKADHDLLQRLVEQCGGILSVETGNTEGWLTETPSSHVE